MSFRNVIVEPPPPGQAPPPATAKLRPVAELLDGAAVASFATTDPELVALARALRGDPDLIFEYVTNTVVTLPRRGSLKGPLGTLLDGYGTAVDQAELMAVLLQQSGLTPTFVVGRISLTAAQLTTWLGTDTSFGSVGRILVAGGLNPDAVVNGNTVVRAEIDWAWVKVSIGGTAYVFDPATKDYQRKSGTPNIASLLGYNQSSFLSGALSGAVVNPNDIRGVNRGNIRTSVGSYANSLFTALLNDQPDAGPDDILGGAAIVPLPLNTRRRDTSLSYATSAMDQPAVPANLRTTLTVTVPGAAAVTFNSSDIYGRRLSLFFDNTVRPVLSLDGSVQRTGTPVSAGADVEIGFSIDHPYPDIIVDGKPVPIADESGTQRVRASAGGAFVISNGWGPVGRATIERHRRILEQNTAANPGNPTAEPVLGESLVMLGFTWLAQVSRTHQIADSLGNTFTIYQHGVGIVGMAAQLPPANVTGPYVDLPFNTFSVIQRTGRAAGGAQTPQEVATFFTITQLSSVLESGSIEQTQPGVPAVSTVKLLDLASGSQPIYDITSVAVFDAVRPQLINYSSTFLDSLRTRVADDFREILHRDGGLQVNLWRGFGYFEISANADGIGSLIRGGYNGGFPTVNQPPAAVNLNAGQQVAPSSLSLNSTVLGTGGGDSYSVLPQGGDPLNLVTGDYVYSFDDLTVGNGPFPYTLAFQRSYDSGRTSSGTVLGPGWRHGFDLSAVPDSDGFEGMAATSPRNGVFSIAAIYVMLDLLKTSGSQPLDRLVICTLVAQYWMEQLIGNVFRVSRPGAVESFVRTGSGRWSAPVGSASALTVGTGNACTLATGDGELLQFGPASPGQPGRITSWASAAGARVDFTYAGGNLTTVTSNLGRTLTLAYTAGRLSSVADGNGRAVTFTYASGRLERVTDPLGNATRYAYDAAGRLTQIFYPAFPNDAFVTNTYDILGAVVEQRDGSGNLTTVYVAGRRTELAEPSGNRHVWYFDPLGKPVLDVQDYGFDADGTLRGNFVTTTRYDGQSRPREVLLPEGNRSETTYDRYSRPLTITRHPKPGSTLTPLVQSFSYTNALAGRDNFRRVTRTTDPGDNITLYRIQNATGNLLTVTQPQVTRGSGTSLVNPVTNYTYTAVGLLQQETDPEGRVTTYEYDAAGNLTARTVDAGTGRLNLRTTWTYDAVGNALTTVSPRGNVAGGTPATFTTNAVYDAKRRLTRSFPNAFPISTEYVYDADDRVREVRRLLTPASGPNPAVFQTTITTYTRTGKVATVTDANGVRVTNIYDTSDRLRFATSSSGRRVIYGYDRLSRITTITDAVFGTLDPTIVSRGTVLRERRSYTANGQLATQRSFRTATLSEALVYTYDGFDRLGEVLYPNGRRELYAYDANGNVTTFTTRAGLNLTSTHDALNRLLTRAVPANPNAPAVSYTYGYDLTGRPLDARQSTDTAAIAYAYDTAGRLISETDAAGRVLTYDYDADGNRISLTWPPAGTTTLQATFDYDAVGRMFRVWEAGQRIAAYGYDLLLRRTSSLYHNLATANWTWRLNNTLESVSHTFTAGVGVTFGYQYNTENAVSARTVSDAAYLPGPGNPALAPGTRAYAVNNMNQYTAVSGTPYSYDLDGNLTGDGTWTYGYDPEGRLVSATRTGTTVAYGYDAVGRRRSRTVGGVTTTFLSSGDQEVAEYDGAGALLRRYVWGPGGPDDIIATIGVTGSVAGRRRFHHADGVGSTVALTSSTAAVLERYAYTPYGVSEGTGGSAPWRYTGRRLDPDTGLYYLRARDYAPLIGRFLQPDPIGTAGGLNLYAYVENDPLNKTDPSGLFWPLLAGGAFGGLSGGYGGYLQGGWRGAAAGFVIGGSAGLFAPLAAARAGGWVAQGGVAVAARVGAFTAVNATGGALGTALAGYVAENPASAGDVIRGAAFSALGPAFTGEAAFVGAAVRSGVVADSASTLIGLYSNVVGAGASFVDSRLRSTPTPPAQVASIASSLDALWNPPGSGLYIGRTMRK